MANIAKPDQLASDVDLHCLQKQGISGFSRTRVNGNKIHSVDGNSVKLSLSPSERWSIFPDRVDPFSEGGWCAGMQKTKTVSIVKNSS